MNGGVKMEKKLAVVTGANGHVGANLVRTLIEKGFRVRVLIRKNSNSLENLPVEKIKGDVLDYPSLLNAFKGVDVLFHLAALISIEGDKGGMVQKINIGGVKNVANAALESGIKRMVHVGSIHAFNHHPGADCLDETRDKAKKETHNSYDSSKASGEVELRKVIEKGLDAVIINPTGIIGPHDYANSRMGIVFKGLYNEKLPGLVNGGFDWVDVRDVVKGILLAYEKGRTGENYIISGHYLKIKDLADIVHSVTGAKIPKFVTPMWLARLLAPIAKIYGIITKKEMEFTSESLEALRGNKMIINQKARDELGYTTNPTYKTVKDTYSWFLKEGHLLPTKGGASRKEKLRRLVPKNV